MSYIETIFETVSSRNKIYCIEASAATHSILPYIKNHVIHTLKSKSHHGDSMKFNLICFNSDVAKWCVSMAPCTSEYITAAADWLRHILPEGSCNFLGALVSALKEPLNCNICFIVTQHPNQEIKEILDLFAYIGRKIPCHIRLCVLGNTITDEIKNAETVYSQIAKETRGTFAFVQLDSDNQLHIMQSTKNIMNSTDLITIVSSNDEENENIKKFEVLREEEKKEIFKMSEWALNPNSIDHESYLLGKVYPETHYKPFQFWKRVSASQSFMDCLRNINESNVTKMAQGSGSKLAASVIVGREVLARKYTNGQYYLGYIKDQVNNELFNIVFGPYNWGMGQFVATDYQETKLLDLIDLNDAMKRSIIPGDRVLAPDPTSPNKDAFLCRYITGTVLHGSVIRDYSTARIPVTDTNEGKNIDAPIKHSENLIIEFTSPLSKTEKVVGDKVIYIPEPFFQRLCLESAMPKSAREKLYKVPNYPLNSLPGYPTSGSKKIPDDFTFTNPNVLKSRTLQNAWETVKKIDYLMPPYCLPLYPVIEIFDKDDRTGNILTKSDWASGNVIKKSNMHKKNETLVPESIYTISELQLKVKDQLETFKDLPESRMNPEKPFLLKGANKKVENDARVAKTVHIKSNEKLLTSYPARKVQIDSEPLVEINAPKKSSSLQSLVIQEEYFEDLRKIRESVNEDKDYSSSSYSRRPSRNRSVAEDGVKRILVPQSGQLFQKSFTGKLEVQNSNAVYITDIGEKDKERETVEKIKLQRHQNQIERRLKEEQSRFCQEEMNKDRHVYFQKQKTAARIHKENLIRQSEQEAIDKAQSLKRSVLSEVENKVKSVEPLPPSYDDVDKKRIEGLKNRMAQRNNDMEKRNQDALKYIEKQELSKRNRSDERWWKAQNQMLKEYPA